MFHVGQNIWVVNAHRNRAYRATITEVTPVDVVAVSPNKDEPLYFHPETGLALGDYWEDAEVRPKAVAEDNPLAIALDKDAQRRAYARQVRDAVANYQNSPGSSYYFNVLKKLVDEWPDNV